MRDVTGESCRLCQAPRLISVLDLGSTPPCESFLTAAELDLPEVTYPLHLRLCPECLLLQIPALITPEGTFTEYAYFSSFSSSWVDHARQFVNEAVNRLELGPQSFVVEVAANDGYLLQHVREAGIPCLGIEPSRNVGEAARALGLEIVADFLTELLASALVGERGPADLVIANNVWAHIPDITGFTRGLRLLVADHGRVSIEVHHALNLVRDAQFDTIYHEHFQYWTVLAARTALAAAGLELIDVEKLSTHGGSIRLWSAPAEFAPAPSPSVEQVIAEECVAGLDKPAGYQGISPRVSKICRDLSSLLISAAETGLRVAGYGAPGKGQTLLNHCGVRPDLLPYLVDQNPYKHGRFTPGSRIPIHPVDHLFADRPDLIVVLPWNLRDELTAQLAPAAEWGARLVYPLPALEVVEPGTGRAV
ncbi:methyltransferase domain-containing protein [Naumannella halotolerans]|uniref:methyltransferase domain-containing protein n=1 Tax=Naumannella halotolerans TaxID=993414 RepID=UPI00370DAE39